jgi:hypothetical protein
MELKAFWAVERGFTPSIPTKVVRQQQSWTVMLRKASQDSC